MGVVRDAKEDALKAPGRIRLNMVADAWVVVAFDPIDDPD